MNKCYHSSNKVAQSGYETQRRRHLKSKTGVSVAPQKALMSSKNFQEKREKIIRVYDVLVLKYFCEI